MRTLFHGTAATRFREGDDEYGVTLRLEEPFRRTLYSLAHTQRRKRAA